MFEGSGSQHQDDYDRDGLTPAGFQRNANRTDTQVFGATEMPLMVRFRDLRDPSTVEIVDPKNLEASFGQGVKFRRATIAISRDPLTTGIERYLPWLVGGQLFDGLVTKDVDLRDESIRNRLMNINFWRHMQTHCVPNRHVANGDC
jgi:hypothetical protein